AEVRLERPESMHAAMEVARRREDHLVATRRGRADARYPKTRRAQPDASDMVPSGRPPDNSRPTNSTRPPVKHLTLEEIRRRREKGLCFKCEERFTPGHQYKQAFVIHVIDPNEEEPEVEKDWEQEVEAGVPKEEAKISMHAMAGTRGPTTMRLPALVKDRRVVVLVDNGSSHNFINADLSRKLKFPTMKVEPFEVRVANGEQLKCSEAYRAIPINFERVTIKADLYALVGPDVVLGVQWLEGLGKVTTDYQMGIMEFDSGEHRVTLKASKDSRAKEFGLKSIERVWHGDGQIFTVEEVGAYVSMVEHVSTEYDGPPIFDVYSEDELMDDEVVEEAAIKETEVEGKVPKIWTIEQQQSKIRELVRASDHVLGKSDKEGWDDAQCKEPILLFEFSKYFEDPKVDEYENESMDNEGTPIFDVYPDEHFVDGEGILVEVKKKISDVIEKDCSEEMHDVNEVMTPQLM
ncbi:Unknown protein, partial [Striga hermonthica]